MRLYLVRHGESELNIEKRHQFPSTKLSARGIQQAHILAERLEKLPIEVIFSSQYDRATQSSEIINTRLSKPIVYSEFLHERKRPSEIEGKPHDDPEVVRIKQEIEDHVEVSAWHYSDEENLSDLERRTRQFLELVSRRTERHVLVVTHGGIMRMLVAVMMFPDELTPKLARTFMHFVLTMNTGITVCQRSDDARWRLVTWNDHAHLG